VSEDMVDVDVCAAARSLLDRAMMLRRLKRDVETSLLPKVICKLFVDMTPLQLRLYNTGKKLVRSGLKTAAVLRLF